MFRSRVFGGTPDAFHLACEYGPESVKSRKPSPEALAPMELDWTSAEAETQVLERFAQRQSTLLLEHADERVMLQLSWEPIPNAAAFPNQRLNVKLAVSSRPPVLRSLHFTRTAGSGTVSDSLMVALLKHMDLSRVWKVRGCEGLPLHFWSACVDVTQWQSLFNLNLSSCGLVSLPSSVGQLASLHVLRLNHNKLTTLPPEIGQLQELEVLSVNHNQLSVLPAELRRCSSLRELQLEYNRLVTPLLDLTHATALESLQLYGNPLEYLPELAPAVGLRSLSLANVRIMADAAYSRWEVEVTAPSSSYTSMVIGGRGHKLQPLFNLVFRRSSIQHPLLAGAMGRLMEEGPNLELLVKEDVALQQLVLAAMGNNPLVVQQAVKVLCAAGGYAGAAKRLVKHNAVRAISGLLGSTDVSLQLSGLRVLSSLAAGGAEGEVSGEVLVPTALLDRLLALIQDHDTHQDVRCAALHALGNSAFDVMNRRRYLQSPGLMQLLVLLAASPDTQPAASDAAGLGASKQLSAAERQETSSTVRHSTHGDDSSGGSSRDSSPVQQPAQLPAATPQHPQHPIDNDVPTGSAGNVDNLCESTGAAAATVRDQGPPANTLETSGQHPGGATAASTTFTSAAAGADAPASASAEPSALRFDSCPVAISPYDSSSSGTGAAAHAASTRPPTLVMHRNLSSAGDLAGAAEATAVAQVAKGTAKFLAAATAQDASASSTAAGDSGAVDLLSPRGAMAAAAGAAAATAAAVGTQTLLPPAKGNSAAAAAAAGKGSSPAASAGSNAAGAAADAAILSKQRLVSVNNPLKLEAIRLLAILGQNEQVRIALGQPPIRGRGLRVLAMDGGGMKGMAMVELLRQLERRAGAPIWQLFDVIGGTSTGGLLAVALGMLRLNMDACQEIYTSLGNKVFTQSTLVQEDAGWRENLYRMYTTSSANMRVAVYGSKHDAANYEDLLRKFCAVKELGCASDRLIDTAVMGGPKVFVVATLASSRPAAPFAFRNYELPDEAAPIAAQLAACNGSCKHHVWEAVRASSAAPYYLDDFLTADGKRFQDGATTANNPAVIALQQARLLHPQLPVDCVVSLGCGAEPSTDRTKGLSAVIDTGAVLLESACSVDRVHEALATTLQMVPGCQYFRFNAVDVRCAMELDDVRPESWSRLISATSQYCSQPQVAAQFDRLAALLKQGAATAPGTTAEHPGSSRQTILHPGSVGRGLKSRLNRLMPGHRTKLQQPDLADRQTAHSLALSHQQEQEQLEQQQQPGSLPPVCSPSSLHVSVLDGTQAAAAGRKLASPGQLQQQQNQQHSPVDEALVDGLFPLVQQQREAGLSCSPSPAPRLLYQRGLLLVAACREVAGIAAAAAAARGTCVSALQQQDCVARLLAASLPQELLHTCDLSAATAVAAAAAADPQFAPSQTQQQQHQQQLSVRDVSLAPGANSKSASLAGSNLRTGSSTSTGSNAQQQQQQAARNPVDHSKPLDGAAAVAAGLILRASDAGGSSTSSPRPSSWFDYIFPWQGGGSGSTLQQQLQQQQQQRDVTSPRQHTSQEAAGGGAAADDGAGGAAGASGSDVARLPLSDGGLNSPRRRGGPEPCRRLTAGSIRVAQSSPDILPQGAFSQQQRQQPEVHSLNGSLPKLKSLPAHYHPEQQQQQQQRHEDLFRSISHSPRALQLPASGGGNSSSSRPQQPTNPAASGAPTGALNSSAVRRHLLFPGVDGVNNTHGNAAAPGGRDLGCYQQQSQLLQQQPGSVAVSGALRHALLSAAGQVGVIHLALHASQQQGLVAGWTQQIMAVVEPGPQATELVQFITGSNSSSLTQLASTKGPLLPGPDGSLVAVLAQQQVLAPVPAASAITAAGNVGNTSSLAASASSAAGSLWNSAIGSSSSSSSVMQFVTSWLLQLTLPDSSRLLGVAEMWPLLSQLQQLLIVSSNWLPRDLVHVLLRSGVAAVVCAADAAEVEALDAADVAEFFRVFYAEGLWQGLDVLEALETAGAAVPDVGDSVYECYQLV